MFDYELFFDFSMNHGRVISGNFFLYQKKTEKYVKRNLEPKKTFEWRPRQSNRPD